MGQRGNLKSKPTPTRQTFIYTYDQYLQFKGINIEHDKRKVVIYARVSTKTKGMIFKIKTAFLRSVL